MSKSKVYSSPTKRSRRLNVRILTKLDKYIARRPYPPGQHGASRRSRPSDYSIQLQEKQKAKFIYGIRERQFKKIYNQATKKKMQTGEKLLQLLELRFDNIVFRAGLAKSRLQARQMITHGHLKINNRKSSIPSTLMKVGDLISPKSLEKSQIYESEIPKWIKINNVKKIVEIKKVPSREDMPSEIDEQLIVEFYSR